MAEILQEDILLRKKMPSEVNIDQNLEPENRGSNFALSGGVLIEGDAIGGVFTTQTADSTKDLHTIPHEIPYAPNDFMGRDNEVKDLLHCFECGAVIVGVRGLGGIGKTVLAYKLAENLRDFYPDGQIMVDLQGTGVRPLKPIEAMGQVIRSFDRTASLPKSESEVANIYRTTLDGKRALLLLDNAFDDRQVRPLLPPPSCGVLVTSRKRFTLPGLKEMDLNTLEREDAKKLLIAIDDRICDYADELAGLCGYLPLALRAAGSLLANTKDLDPAKYIQDLKKERTRLQSLGSQGVDIDVDASFGLSYAGLNENAKRVFRILSVFPADFDAEAEVVVCKDERHQGLSDLTKWCLVDYLKGTSQNNQKGIDRYRLHDLARVFASIRFKNEDNERARFNAQRRYSEHYRSVLKTAEEFYKSGGENVLAGLKLFDREWVNIQAGRAWAKSIALQGKHHPSSKISKKSEIALSLCISYPHTGDYVLSLRLHPHDLIGWLKTALDAARRLKDRDGECLVMGNLGIAYKNLGESYKSLEFHKQSLAIAIEIGDRRAEGNALSSLGIAYKNLGEYQKALKLLARALIIAREIDNRRGEGTAINRLGMVYKNLGDYETALGLHKQALAIAREKNVGNRRGEGTALNRLGIAYKNLGDYETALESHREALAIAREIGDRRGEGAALCNIGNTYRSLGDCYKAITFFKQHLAIAREIGDRRGEGAVLGYMGIAYYDLRDYNNAIMLQDQSLDIARAIGDRRREGNALWNRSLALNKIGDKTQSIIYAKIALEVYEQIGSPFSKVVKQQLIEWEN